MRIRRRLMSTSSIKRRSSRVVDVKEMALFLLIMLF